MTDRDCTESLCQVNGIYILKSGSDFRQFSKLTLDFRENPIAVEIESVDVTKEIEQDEKLSNSLEAFTGRKTKYFIIQV